MVLYKILLLLWIINNYIFADNNNNISYVNKRRKNAIENVENEEIFQQLVNKYKKKNRKKKIKKFLKIFFLSMIILSIILGISFVVIYIGFPDLYESLSNKFYKIIVKKSKLSYIDENYNIIKKDNDIIPETQYTWLENTKKIINLTILTKIVLNEKKI